MLLRVTCHVLRDTCHVTPAQAVESEVAPRGEILRQGQREAREGGERDTVAAAAASENVGTDARDVPVREDGWGVKVGADDGWTCGGGWQGCGSMSGADGREGGADMGGGVGAAVSSEMGFVGGEGSGMYAGMGVAGQVDGMADPFVEMPDIMMRIRQGLRGEVRE